MQFFHNNKLIGTLKDNIFRKRVKKSKHLLRKLDAWGIQYDAFTELRNLNCEEIRIKDEDEDRVYAVAFDTIFKKGRVEDLGDGMQVFLPRSEWSIQ